jgi:hypothetical protein
MGNLFFFSKELHVLVDEKLELRKVGEAFRHLKGGFRGKVLEWVIRVAKILLLQPFRLIFSFSLLHFSTKLLA